MTDMINEEYDYNSLRWAWAGKGVFKLNVEKYIFLIRRMEEMSLSRTVKFDTAQICNGVLSNQ